MLATDRDALLCDLAETYHIFDLRALPGKTLAALSVGLRPDSRIKMKMSGMQYISPLVLQCEIADHLALLRYSLTAQQGDTLPKLYTGLLFENGEAKKRTDNKAFNAARDEIVSRVKASLKVIDNG